MKSAFVNGRIGKLALIGVMLAVAACTDSTAPDTADDLSPVDGKVVPNTAVTALAPWFPEATMYVIDDIATKPVRDKLTKGVNDLSAALKAYNVNEIKKQITAIRNVVNSASEDEQIELGPIEVALETVEDAMGII